MLLPNILHPYHTATESSGKEIPLLDLCDEIVISPPHSVMPHCPYTGSNPAI